TILKARVKTMQKLLCFLKHLFRPIHAACRLAPWSAIALSKGEKISKRISTILFMFPAQKRTYYFLQPKRQLLMSLSVSLNRTKKVVKELSIVQRYFSVLMALCLENTGN